MSDKLRLIFFLFLIPFQLKSQIFPGEGSSLNYRIVGFSFTPDESATNYKVEISAGNYNSDDSFRHNIVRTINSGTNRVIEEVPSFGSNYTWRVIYYRNHTNVRHSALHHFTTKMIPNVDTCLYRLSVLKAADKYKDAYVFLDDSKVLYDMNGNPVWFLPPIDGINVTPRDIKLSYDNNITLLFNPPYEVNYNGEILWKGSMKGVVNGEYSENYHHEFTKLHNGHYMVLGTENVYWNQASGSPHDFKKEPPKDTLYKKTPFGTIIEYDEQGNVVWSWKSSDYFTGSDLVNYTPSDGAQTVDVHENAFYFDERTKNIYISYKNINRIIKLKYPEGIVVGSYGEIYKPGVPEKGNGLFCGQHSCNISKRGYLYLYDNNVCEPDTPPKLVVMEEPATEKDSLQKVWEYQCTIEGARKQDLKNYHFISGGSVQELPDQSLFACMNGTYSKLFIVNKDKELLWSALAQRWDETKKKWEMSGQYRAYLIEDRKKLEQLIWNALPKS